MIFRQALFAAVLLGGTSVVQARLEIRPAASLDLGGFPAESAPVASFELVNTGSNSLRIAKVESGCNCFEPVAYEKSIPPGGSTPLDVFINGNLLSGSFEKEIQLRIGGETPTNATLTIKGTARPAIPNVPKFVFAGRTAVGQPWETNILLHVRQDLTETPTLRMEGRSRLKGELAPTATTDQFNIKISMPPQPEPFYWESRIVLSFSESPAIPPIPIKANGYNGGTLHVSPGKVKPAGKSASFILQRTYPAGAIPNPTQLHGNETGIEIRETPLPKLGKSRVELTFSEAFLQRLEEEGRIAVSLSVKGFIPTTLVVGQ